MALKGRNQIPKSQRDISLSQQEVYDKERGNPNLLTNQNRANQISFEDETYKPFSVGIEDIDNAIFYYFKNIIKPFVIQNGERVDVPIIYGSPEKWKSVQKDGYYKDEKGQIMLPLLIIKKENIEKVRTIANKLDANNPNNLRIFTKTWNNKNSYDNFSVLNNIKPQKTNYVGVVPDYITITYSCIISTYYLEQLNKLIEAIEYASDSYWGEENRFKFKTKIDTFSIKTEISDNDERIVNSNFTLKIDGYIVPDVLQKDLNSIKKLPSKTKLVFTTETSVSSSYNQ